MREYAFRSGLTLTALCVVGMACGTTLVDDEIPPVDRVVDAGSSDDAAAPGDASAAIDASDAGSDAPPLADLGPSCDLTTFQQATSSFDDGIGKLGTFDWKVFENMAKVDTQSCPGAKGGCLHVKLDAGAVEHQGLVVATVNLGQSSTAAMRLCFHVYVDLDVGASGNDYFTLGAVSSGGDPRTSVQLWPHASTGVGDWTLLSYANQGATSASAEWSSPVPRTKTWHKVQVDTAWAAAGGGTLITVDGVTKSSAASFQPWTPVGVPVYIGLQTYAGSVATEAWFADVRLGWK